MLRRLGGRGNATTHNFADLSAVNLKGKGNLNKEAWESGKIEGKKWDTENNIYVIVL